MVDTISTSMRSLTMSKVRSKDTKPEIVVRKMIHQAGYRYRLHDRALPGVPDLVFKTRKKIIFVHGCFWHRHEGCVSTRTPKSRVDFWATKLDGNRDRDLIVQAKLVELGWKILIIWECELRKKDEIWVKINDFLKS